MKKINILLALILCLTFVTCKKDIEPDMPKVTISKTDASANNVVISGTYEYSMEVTSFEILYSDNENMTLAQSNKITPEGNDFNITIEDLNPNTTYYYCFLFTSKYNSAETEKQNFKTLEEVPENPEDPEIPEDPEVPEDPETINGYAYVDLGLPSGLKWATCNVGANDPEDYGDYFAWGETETKGDYSSTNSATFGLTLSDLQSQGYIDGNDNLTSSYDAATENWGSPWRMPATSELNELLNSCTWTWTTQNGINGYIVTGPNGNSIFLPAAGYYRRSSLQKDGELGRYWSSTPDKREYDDISDRLGFDSSVQEVDWDYRYYGRSVRAVSGEYIPGETIQLPAVTTNDISNITANSAVCGGNVTSDGGAAVTARGICWSETQNPSLNNIYSEETNDGSGTGTFTSQLSNLKENTTYYVRAYATNGKGTAYGEVKSFKTSSITGTINGYSYVDLGLPSGLKWATRNVGANNPENYGNYYAWGETETKTEYTEDNSDTHRIPMDDISGKAGYDVAKNSWGSTWRMPTKSEMVELLNNCTLEWITRLGVNGYKVTGPNGNHIFLPAAGWRSGDAFLSAGELGYYWSSTPIEDYDGLYSEYNTTAYRIGFEEHNVEVHRSYRYIGFTVRAVSE